MVPKISAGSKVSWVVCYLTWYGHYYVLLSGFNLKFSLPVSQTGGCPSHPLLSTSSLHLEGGRQHHQAQLLACQNALSYLSVPSPHTHKWYLPSWSRRFWPWSMLLVEHYDEAESPCCSHCTQQPPVSNIIIWHASLVAVLYSINLWCSKKHHPH